jgi:hypothetical protein
MTKEEFITRVEGLYKSYKQVNPIGFMADFSRAFVQRTGIAAVCGISVPSA